MEHIEYEFRFRIYFQMHQGIRLRSVSGKQIIFKGETCGFWILHEKLFEHINEKKHISFKAFSWKISYRTETKVSINFAESKMMFILSKQVRAALGKFFQCNYWLKNFSFDYMTTWSESRTLNVFWVTQPWTKRAHMSRTIITISLGTVQFI